MTGLKRYGNLAKRGDVDCMDCDHDIGGSVCSSCPLKRFDRKLTNVEICFIFAQLDSGPEYPMAVSEMYTDQVSAWFRENWKMKEKDQPEYGFDRSRELLNWLEYEDKYKTLGIKTEEELEEVFATYCEGNFWALVNGEPVDWCV